MVKKNIKSIKKKNKSLKKSLKRKSLKKKRVKNIKGGKIINLDDFPAEPWSPSTKIIDKISLLERYINEIITPDNLSDIDTNIEEFSKKLKLINGDSDLEKLNFGDNQYKLRSLITKLKKLENPPSKISLLLGSIKPSTGPVRSFVRAGASASAGAGGPALAVRTTTGHMKLSPIGLRTNIQTMINNTIDKITDKIDKSSIIAEASKLKDSIQQILPEFQYFNNAEETDAQPKAILSVLQSFYAFLYNHINRAKIVDIKFNDVYLADFDTYVYTPEGTADTRDDYTDIDSTRVVDAMADATDAGAVGDHAAPVRAVVAMADVVGDRFAPVRTASTSLNVSSRSNRFTKSSQMPVPSEPDSRQLDKQTQKLRKSQKDKLALARIRQLQKLQQDKIAKVKHQAQQAKQAQRKLIQAQVTKLKSANKSVRPFTILRTAPASISVAATASGAGVPAPTSGAGVAAPTSGAGVPAPTSGAGATLGPATAATATGAPAILPKFISAASEIPKDIKKKILRYNTKFANTPGLLVSIYNEYLIYNFVDNTVSIESFLDKNNIKYPKYSA